MVDYNAELEVLKKQEEETSGEYWKPEAGQYKVKSLGEIEDAPPYEEEGKEPQLRKQIRIVLPESDKPTEEHIWSMPLGKTPASTYGQLVKLAAAKNNTLKDVEFSVVVTGAGKNKRFTIVA